MASQPRILTVPFSALVISCLYLLTRAGVFARELTFEESVFLMPGRFLFEGRGYFAYLGEFFPHSNPFHKPPLTSLLLGLFSCLSPDGIATARLLPFLVGWFVVLLPLLLTRSAVPSVVVLCSHFLWSAASHMQTDSTLILLGYCLVLIYLYQFLQKDPQANRYLLPAGLIVLWWAKLESAAIVVVTLAASSLLLGWRKARTLWFKLIIWSVAGLASCMVLTWLLGATAGFSAAASISEVFGTVVRVLAGQLSSNVRAGGFGVRGRTKLLEEAWATNGTPTFLICLGAVVLVWITGHPRHWTRWRVHIGLLTATLLPLGVILVVAYPGDGYPRYFLIVFPPLLLLLGDGLSGLTSTPRVIVSTATVIVATLVLGPKTLEAMGSPGSPNSYPGAWGIREAAAIVGAETSAGDLVAAPDAAILYLPDRRLLVEETYVPYRDRHDQVRAFSPHVRALILRRPPGAGGAQDILGVLVTAMRQKGARLHQAGSYDVMVETAREPKPLPQCKEPWTPAISRATARPAQTANLVTLSIEGACFQADTVQLEVRGRGCEQGCRVPPSAVVGRSDGALQVHVELPTGSYLLTVINGNARRSAPYSVLVPNR